MFWICAGNIVANCRMFSLLLSASYTVSRPFLLLTAPHQWVGWGCIRGLERTQPGQLTLADQRDIPVHLLLGKKEGGDFQSDGICLPMSLLCDGVLSSRRWLNIYLPVHG